MRDVTPRWHYDEGADVLYLSFGEPTAAICHEPEPGVLVRVRPDAQDQVVGLTLVGAKHILREKLGLERGGVRGEAPRGSAAGDNGGETAGGEEEE